MSDSKIAEAILIASTHSEGMAKINNYYYSLIFVILSLLTIILGPGTVVYVEVEGCGTLGLSKRRELVNKARKAVAEKSVLLDVVVVSNDYYELYDHKMK